VCGCGREAADLTTGEVAMRIGIYQCDAGGWTPAQRLARLEAVLAARPLDLLLCPELYASGYHIGADLARLAEPVDGPFATEVAQIARRHGTATAYGFAEPGPTGLLNAALCIGADGTVLAHHHKTMIPPGYERGHFVPGRGHTLFDLGGLRFALLICYENEFPEAVRAMAQVGAQVILAPTALDAAWDIVAQHVIPTRAFDNHVWMVYANHTGVEAGKSYAGQSCIVDPFGRVVVRAGSGDAVIAATVGAAPVAAARAALGYVDGSTEVRARLEISG